MKKKDSLIVRATWKLRNILPDPVENLCLRGYRRVLQAMGGPFAHRRRGVVAMLHIGRCGSTVLANMLTQNAEVYWDGKTARRAHEMYGEAVKRLDMRSWFKQQFAISGSKYYGFEFKILNDQYVQIFDQTVPGFLQACQDIGVTHFILLYRKNTLNQAISHYSGLNNKVWHISPEAQGKPAKKSFTIDFSKVTSGSGPGLQLADYLRDIEDTKSDIRQLLTGQNLLELEYEADILDTGPMTAYRKICNFLQIDAGDVSVRNRKVLTVPPSEAVENYAEAIEALQGTAFEWMLHQDPKP